MITCASPIALASLQLKDAANITWPTAVMIDYLNYAVEEILRVKPEAGSVCATIPLVPSTRQTLPENWTLLINAKRNMGSGSTPGRAITPVERTALDSALPDWQSFPANAEVRHVITDDRDPYAFDVFPPQPAGTAQKIEAIGCALPSKVANLTDAFPLPDEFEVSACDYLVYRALAEETSIPNALAKSGQFYQKFLQGLGIMTQSETKARSEGQ